MSATSKLLEMFYTLNLSGLERAEREEDRQNGIRIPNAVFRRDDGKFDVAALAMYGPTGPRDTYLAVTKFLRDGRPVEAAWGIDRWTRPGQGTTRANVLSVHYLNRGVWKFGIVEYDVWPHVVTDPICWTNAHWIAALHREQSGFWRGQRYDLEPAPPSMFGPEETVAEVLARLNAAKGGR